MRTVCFFCFVFNKKKTRLHLILKFPPCGVLQDSLLGTILFFIHTPCWSDDQWVKYIFPPFIWLIFLILNAVYCTVFGLLGPNFRSFYSDTQTWVNAWTKVLITCATVSALCWHTNHQRGTWCFVQLRKSKNLKMCQKIKVCL